MHALASTLEHCAFNASRPEVISPSRWLARPCDDATGPDHGRHSCPRSGRWRLEVITIGREAGELDLLILPAAAVVTDQMLGYAVPDSHVRAAFHREGVDR